MRDKSPGFKLFMAGLCGFVLLVPLLMVYALVNDRQGQARIAERTITAGSGGAQVVSGPVIEIPYNEVRTVNEVVDGNPVVRTNLVRKSIFVSPVRHQLETGLAPERKKKALYETVIYLADMEGKARFELPEEFSIPGVSRDRLLLGEAQIRFGASDPRGLRAAANVRVGGKPLALEPGGGTRASDGAGFHGAIDWSGGKPLVVNYDYTLRGSRQITLMPLGGQTDWSVTSTWPHPAFGGGFIPDERDIGNDGFSARWSIGNLALNQPMVAAEDFEPPHIMAREAYDGMVPEGYYESEDSETATISLVEPGDIYAQVDRSVKYGFLFIGFTFVAFLLFDVVGGARVAAAEYLLTGAGLILFFVLLLAFAEWTGFAIAYVIASAAIIGLLTAYSAAVLGGWKRAGFIGTLLTVLYGVLYVLLSLEDASLIVGSVMMFMALAGVMYATRNVEWSEVTKGDERSAE
ncbi:cell envelope integrity protein CreD [Qipengyuania sp. 1NDH17]|uniref:Cell envelope integrity protein CreD n=1 Tax=Qipengyuania polymorpha TaxID=2867234 RepID=A0ABS7IW50_9SPHN|nr:cell envelope integrity protein CreD [Qipengyuania polymorpha]MBX7457528.1 cell envelope integrity protein CreD [Qipengyuania polymorpha]